MPRTADRGGTRGRPRSITSPFSEAAHLPPGPEVVQWLVVLAQGVPKPSVHTRESVRALGFAVTWPSPARRVPG